MDDISDQLAARDRFRRAVYARQSPAERMEAMRRLQRMTWRVLQSSPNGYAHFLRRNFRARAVDVPVNADAA